MSDNNNNNNNNNNDDDNDEVISMMCEKHKKKEKVICWTCKMSMCTVSMSNQRGHDMSHVDHIKECLMKKEYDGLWCMPRLNHLWKTLQQCVESYQSLEQTHKEVSDHFEQLFKLLMAQEHKIKTPINVQMSHIQSTNNNIIDEINDLNHILNMSHQTDSNSNQANMVHDVSEVIGSILSCSTINQFISKLSSTQSQQSEKDTDAINDNELMMMIKNHNQHMNDVQYDLTKLQTQSMKNEMIKLNDTKNKIKSCLGLIEQVQQPAVQHPFNNHINMIDDGFSLLSLDTFKWTTHKKVLPRRVDHFSTECVYARGHIYQFGGSSSPTRFSNLTCR
ncbi:hypothetical protein SAMD00019534_056470 [Acytostelium subglobosum LB1]|uniref:hypothetical protein n=1 Tax=Acytostelium subglobosum LB1 TaxID=1410327 RepID=UPI000644C039|nr:hypothetical protein SAMD00019534_056470 [Acytostelium subglobosum LB1]GAM22472.1 hypothetical protein SAMD00019534_056470 [Acytostelium subglobosum LB1]|eukprot:XP_012754592.1 hypothetical protein SAMD00019534_056470 [Acytostelium subglobosum LB1]